MKKYQLENIENGFKEIITFSRGRATKVTFITSDNTTLKISNQKLFGFLLAQIMAKKIEGRLAHDIIEDYRYQFNEYCADSMQLIKPEYQYLHEEAVFPEIFKTFRKAMKAEPNNILIPYRLVKELIKAKEYSAAMFLYSTLSLAPTPQTPEFASITSEIMQKFNANRATFKTNYSVNGHETPAARPYQAPPVFKSRPVALSESEEMQIALALSKSNNDDEADELLARTREDHECEQAIALSLNQAPEAKPGYSFFAPRIDLVAHRKGFSSICNKDIIDLLNPPENYQIGKAVDDGGCFFDSLGQILNYMQGTHVYTEQYLRNICSGFFLDNPDFVNALHLQDYGKNANPPPYEWIVQRANTDCGAAIWGRSHVEGIILCRALTEYILPAIHVVEFIANPEDNQYIPVYYRVTRNGYAKVDPEGFYTGKIPVLMVTQEDRHFVPMLPLALEDNEELERAIAKSNGF